MYGESNVAFAGTGTLVATDENGITSEKKLTIGFSTPPSSGYTAASDITKEIARSEEHMTELQLRRFISYLFLSIK